MAWVVEDILRAIGAAPPGECVTEARIVELTGCDAPAIDNATRKMVKRGWLVKTSRGCWKLTPAGRTAFETGQQVRSGPRGPWTRKKVHKDSVRVRVWRAMRIRVKASAPELAQIVARGGERDIESNIHKYLRLLCRAGYVKLLATRERGAAITSNGFQRYWLINNTGPSAPVYQSRKGVFWDPNTEQEVRLCG